MERKDKISKAQSKEEAKGLIGKADMKINDNEMETVTGGAIHSVWPAGYEVLADFDKGPYKKGDVIGTFEDEQSAARYALSQGFGSGMVFSRHDVTGGKYWWEFWK